MTTGPTMAAIFGLVTSAQILVQERKARTLPRLMTPAMRPWEIVAGHLLAMFADGIAGGFRPVCAGHGLPAQAVWYAAGLCRRVLWAGGLTVQEDGCVWMIYIISSARRNSTVMRAVAPQSSSPS